MVVLVASVLVALLLDMLWLPHALADGAPGCTTAVKYGTINQQTGVMVGRKCVDSRSPTPTPHPPSDRTPKPSTQPVTSSSGSGCDVVLPWFVTPGDKDTMPAPFLSPFFNPPQRVCYHRVLLGGATNPATKVVQDQATRLLPLTQVGTTALASGFTRPNVQTIFWAQTPSSLDLGTVTVLGQPIALKADFAEAVWDFGDHTSTVQVTAPGKAYVDGTCSSAPQCPDYFGHTYTLAGHVTVTLTVAWTVSYSAGGGDWTQLPEPLTTQATQATINIVTNRAVLVPNPGG